ncbi:Lpg1974 family pore-forming outer membrane protein [Planctomicrobium piriforme]|uniref:Uncharacterized protein n=1 Tax=Planctomicrobium piriforme TaxID=1576369 RepID=A0A1I3P7Y2_9PLAN|nr:Lpg1974 family pore-forming outer membrane protein [Planctomicrobium piriforme]SFJ17136.1 hypothetical protein SAMN05421753_11653 [Planctomicrobium piriforme]
MNLHGATRLCTAALCLMAASWVLGGEPDGSAANQKIGVPPLADFACDEVPCSAGVSLDVYVPNLTPGLELSAGLLYLKPGADNLGYATITTFLPLGNPQWAVQDLNPGYQPGFTVGARYVFPGTGKDLRVNWDHLRTSDGTSVSVSDPATQWISPFNQTGPSTSESANEVGIFHLKSADGQVDFAYDMVNLDMGQTVNIGSKTQVRLFGGLTGARLQEQLVSTFYNFPDLDPVPPVVAIPDPTLRYITFNNTSTFTGLGPRLGLNTTHKLFRGFSFVSQLSGAVLAGRKQPAQYSFAAVFDDVVNREQIASRSVSQVVYNGDAKLGLGYNRPFSNGSILNLESGFKAAVFINPFSTYETSTNVLPLDIGSLSTNSMRHTPSNFTLQGFYATSSLQW